MASRKSAAERREKLTLARLASYDDIITDVLVDRVYFWSRIQKNRTKYSHARGLSDEQVPSIIRDHIITSKDPEKAESLLLQLPPLQKFVARLGSPREKEWFHRHLRKYINVYLPDCPFEVTTTNRYTITTHEAAVTARRFIHGGETIKGLTGTLVAMTREEEQLLDMTRRDFSIVMSSRRKSPSIFLGPARFANHDCNANCKLVMRSSETMEVVAVRDVDIDEEITVTYGDNYFGEDNCECLCRTCEGEVRNGWAWRESSGEEEEEEEEEVGGDVSADTPLKSTEASRGKGKGKGKRRRSIDDTIPPSPRKRLPSSTTDAPLTSQSELNQPLKTLSEHPPQQPPTLANQPPPLDTSATTSTSTSIKSDSQPIISSDDATPSLNDQDAQAHPSTIHQTDALVIPNSTPASAVGSAIHTLQNQQTSPSTSASAATTAMTTPSAHSYHYSSCAALQGQGVSAENLNADGDIKVAVPENTDAVREQTATSSFALGADTDCRSQITQLLLDSSNLGSSVGLVGQKMMEGVGGGSCNGGDEKSLLKEVKPEDQNKTCAVQEVPDVKMEDMSGSARDDKGDESAQGLKVEVGKGNGSDGNTQAAPHASADSPLDQNKVDEQESKTVNNTAADIVQTTEPTDPSLPASQTTATTTTQEQQQPRRRRRRTTSHPPIPPEPTQPSFPRYPGDYHRTPKLIAKRYDRWIECTTCHNWFLQSDSYHTRRECPRCERHSKLYGYRWPKTQKWGVRDTEERVLDHRTVHRFLDREEEAEVSKRDRGCIFLRGESKSRGGTPFSGCEVGWRVNSMSPGRFGVGNSPMSKGSRSFTRWNSEVTVMDTDDGFSEDDNSLKRVTRASWRAARERRVFSTH